MWKKILEVPRRAVYRAMGFLGTLKSDEKGLSGVVVAILLILVAVLAIVLIWGFLSGWLQELWEQITSGASTIR